MWGCGKSAMRGHTTVASLHHHPNNPHDGAARDAALRGEHDRQRSTACARGGQRRRHRGHGVGRHGPCRGVMRRAQHHGRDAAARAQGRGGRRPPADHPHEELHGPDGGRADCGHQGPRGQRGTRLGRRRRLAGGHPADGVPRERRQVRDGGAAGPGLPLAPRGAAPGRRRARVRPGVRRPAALRL